MDTESHPSALDRRRSIERSIITEYRKSLWRPFTKALGDYELVADGDRIAVCISGGKDSMLLAKLFQELRLHGRRNFELEFLTLDPGYPDEALRSIERNAELLGIPLQWHRLGIFGAVQRMGGNPCYPCARMRRGALYSAARDLGCNKIALGHHFDDVIETNLMSILYAGQVKTMMPKLHSTNFEGMELIRPLYLVREADIVAWRDAHGLSFIHCACPLSATGTCDAGEGSKRDETKRLIRELAAKDPFVEKNIFKSMDNVHLDAVRGYRSAGTAHSFLETYDM